MYKFIKNTIQCTIGAYQGQKFVEIKTSNIVFC